MTDMLDAAAIIDPPDRYAFGRGLRGYLAAVADALGVGLESCAIDPQPPASAYLALDQRVPTYPERDLALLWDERYGWSAAVETHSGEDLIVLAYFGDDPLPAPAAVARFVADVRMNHQVGPAKRPDLTGRDLKPTLRGYDVANWVSWGQSH